jgi:uncharacterized FAD-dependent dehydrogenase
MTYKILSTRQIEETLITTVEYNFDNEIVVVDVPHFMPQNSQVIIQNIINASQSELARINAKNIISNIINDLNIGEENPL